MVQPVPFSAPERSVNSSANPLLRAGLLVLFSYVFLANHWMGDDAYITYRVVWNFIHGHGLTFNPDERVQAYTHPLWMFTMAAAHFVTREFFFTGTFVSWAFGVTTILLLVRWAGSAPRAVLAVAWLLSSKAFVDYTSSGLENPLTYLLVVLFYRQYLSRSWGATPEPREVRTLSLIASLGFLTRPDAVLLFALPLAELGWALLRRHPRRAVSAAAIGVAPAVLWLAFATFYYGFPLPNTYYAKVANGLPALLLYKQGVAYLLNSISHDPVTLGTIGVALLASLGGTRSEKRAALSAALYVAYTVSVGGDFMSGRFFAAPFLVAVMVLTPSAAQLSAHTTLAALVLYNLLMPIVPIKSSSRYDAAWPWRTQNGIKDERGSYFQGTNILFFSPFRQLPDFTWVREGTSFRSGTEKVTVQGSIGFYGLYAGPDKFLVDRNALSDPLLARLPVSARLPFEFYAGHYFRDIPEGYLESVAQNTNLLTDPVLHEYYDRLRSVTRGPLLNAARLRNIVALNVGRYRNFHQQVLKRRPIELSIRADNERFTTDVGDRDLGKGTLRSTGRSGYLQFGPGIPVQGGMYRARWLGTTDQPTASPLGFVEAWTGSETRLARQAVTADPSRSDHVLATLDFTVPEGGASELEYRFFVNSGAQVTLERIELYSGSAIPPAAP